MRSTYRVPDLIRLFPEYLKKSGYYCTNNSKTDYNLSPVNAQAWDAITGGDHHKRQPGQPFFAVYNLGTSHESSLHQPVDQKLIHSDIPLPPYHPDTPEIRANWAKYYEILTRMDGQVGAILEKLDEDGLADDTIVFYFSDHGGILTRSKRYLYDTGVHVPMIVRFGKNFSHLAPQAAGTKTDRLVSFIDLAPTVLSLAGVPIPEYMQGHAFLGASAAEPQPYVYCFRGRMDERYDMMRSVRDKQFKYIRNYMPHRIYGQHLNYLWLMPATRSWQQAYLEGKCVGPQKFFWEPKPVEELYDVTKDPWEVNNLAADPAFADVLARMRAANREHLLRIRDSGFLPEGEMVARSQVKTTYELVRDEKRYPLEKIMDAAETATMRNPAALPRLLEMLQDKDSAMRYWGATGCVILGKEAESASDVLVKQLKDECPNVRIAAAEALCKLGRTDQALPVLIEAVSPSDAPYALHAMNVLEEIGEAARPALDVIKASVKDKGYVGRAASYTLSHLQESR